MIIWLTDKNYYLKSKIWVVKKKKNALKILGGGGAGATAPAPPPPPAAYGLGNDLL